MVEINTSLFDVSNTLMKAQNYRGNALNQRITQQSMQDNQDKRRLRGNAFSGDQSAIGELFVISPSEALAASKVIDGIKNLNDPKKLINISKRSDFMLGFLAQVDSAENPAQEWNSNIEYLKSINYDTKELGEYTPKKMEFLTRINSDIKKETAAKLATIDVGKDSAGNYMTQQGFVEPGQTPQFIGERAPKYKPSQGKRGDVSITSQDASSIGKAVGVMYGGAFDPLTENFTGLDASQMKEALGVRVRANDIYQQAKEAGDSRMTFDRAALQAAEDFGATFSQLPQPPQGGNALNANAGNVLNQPRQQPQAPPQSIQPQAPPQVRQKTTYPSPEDGGSPPIQGARWGRNPQTGQGGWFVVRNGQTFEVQ